LDIDKFPVHSKEQQLPRGMDLFFGHLYFLYKRIQCHDSKDKLIGTFKKGGGGKY
jgi:hypothetical protein